MYKLKMMFVGCRTSYQIVTGQNLDQIKDRTTIKSKNYSLNL